ncbi:MAG: OmpA family protein [Fibrobacteria bacterium]|nr:OmpA family protein [Fibrobacteria bacterium]
MNRLTMKWVLGVLLIVIPVLANNMNTGGLKGLLRTMTVETNGKSGLNVGGTMKYDVDPSFSKGWPGAGGVQLNNSVTMEDGIDQLYSYDIFASYGLMRAWDIAIDWPIYHDRTGFGYDHTAFGNLEISSKMRYPFKQEQYFINQAYYLKFVIPTGGDKGSGFYPRHAYYVRQNSPNNFTARYSSQAWVLKPMMIWTAHFDRLNPNIPVKVHANLGGAIHSAGTAIAALGIEYNPIRELSLFLEISGESRIMHYTTTWNIEEFNNDIFLVSPGIKYQPDNGFYATLGFDIGIADDDYRTEWDERTFQFSTKGTPIFGVQLTVGWSGLRKEADSDNDGVLNIRDKCPDDKEDMDNFQDDDGCPDIDNDEDGVMDKADKCPLIAAVSDGCPVADTDGDGIADKGDKCPSKAEDIDKFQDDDGCPDVDNDGDNIYDESDKCPNVAEDMDGFEDTDGCPELDNDSDGILDSLDKCPNHLGSADNNGCPSKETFQKGKLVLLNVAFETGSSVLTTNSYTILDYIIETLKEWTDVKLEIQGHTDNIGTDERNQQISQDRAESVMNYLTSKGVAKDRLKAVGFGESTPIADNNTAIGRAQNRRVVIKRID